MNKRFNIQYENEYANIEIVLPYPNHVCDSLFSIGAANVYLRNELFFVAVAFPFFCLFSFFRWANSKNLLCAAKLFAVKENNVLLKMTFAMSLL